MTLGTMVVESEKILDITHKEGGVYSKWSRGRVMHKELTFDLSF